MRMIVILCLRKAAKRSRISSSRSGQPLRARLGALRAAAQLGAQQSQVLAREVAHRLVDGVLEGHRIGLGREVGILGRRGEHQVHLGHAPAQQRAASCRDAPMRLRSPPRAASGRAGQEVAARVARRDGLVGQCALVVALELFPRMPPGVALVGHVAREQASVTGLSPAAPVLEVGGQRRGVLVAVLRSGSASSRLRGWARRRACARTLSMKRSPKRTDVLDCSTPSKRGSSATSAGPRSSAKCEARHRHDFALLATQAAAAVEETHDLGRKAGSASASTSRPMRFRLRPGARSSATTASRLARAQRVGRIAREQQQRHEVAFGVTIRRNRPARCRGRRARRRRWHGLDQAGRAGAARLGPNQRCRRTKRSSAASSAAALRPAARRATPPTTRPLPAAARRLRPSRPPLGRLEREPVEGVRPEREQVVALADPREGGVAEQLARNQALVSGEVEFDVLREARQVGDHQDLLAPRTARRKTSTRGLAGCRNSIVPRPKAR